MDHFRQGQGGVLDFNRDMGALPQWRSVWVARLGGWAVRARNTRRHARQNRRSQRVRYHRRRRTPGGFCSIRPIADESLISSFSLASSSSARDGAEMENGDPADPADEARGPARRRRAGHQGGRADSYDSPPLHWAGPLCMWENRERTHRSRNPSRGWQPGPTAEGLVRLHGAT